MGKALILINSTEARERARHWIAKARWNSRITFQGPKRSLPQNDKMWAMLTDVSDQQLWHGQRLTPTDWKDIFTAALKRELRMVRNLEDDGYVLLGAHTSDMEKDEMSDLIELMFAKGAEWGVVWSEPAKVDEQARALEHA